MPLQDNLNVAPYYADYTPLSDYYSILFKAGYPIQARELTNMQLMQQNQTEQFMSKFFKAGDTIVPGEYAYNISAYARVSSITQGATAEEFVGYTLTGTVSGVVATVYHATPEDILDDITFYVTYESSGTTSEYTEFIEGETLESNTPNRYTAVVGVSGVSKPLAVEVLGELQECPALGRGSIFTIEEGSYFIDGAAVRNDRQIITLDKYSTLPSYQIGFNVTEEFITSNQDTALLDNSQGSSNFAAPGADRLKINLTLYKSREYAINTNFIEIVTLYQGSIVKEPTKQENWAWLYDILAKRTSDESGDYIVTDFPVELMEYWNTDEVNGLYNADADGTYPPLPGSGETINLSFNEADQYYVLKLSPGAAYVQGVNVGTQQPVYLYGRKPRTQNFRSDVVVSITTPFDIKITNVSNAPDFSNSTAAINTTAFEGVTLYRNFIDGYVGESVTADGPYNIGSAPPVTYHVLTSTDIGTIDEAGISGVVYKGGRGAVVQVPSNKIVARFDGTAETGSGSVVNQIGGANVLVAIRMNPSPAGVVYPRYLQPKNIIEARSAEGTAAEMAVAGFDSTYDMGIIKSDFFNEFAIISDTGTLLNTTDWSVGNIVTGEKSRTFATVEAQSTPDMLILSNIVGEFEAGEFVSQVLTNGTTKIGRIAKEGDPLGFHFPDSTISSLSGITSIVVSALGSNRTLVSADFLFDVNTNSLSLTPAGREKLRNFPFPEGSALQRNRVDVAARATNGSSFINGYVITIPSKTENSFSKTKSFFSALTDTGNFSADMAIENNLETDAFRVAGGSVFRGSANTNKLVCNDWGGNPSTELVFGDLITFTDNNGVEQSRLCYFATEPVGYGSNRARAAIYLTTPLDDAVSSSGVTRIRIKPKGQPQNNLIFQLPQETVATLESDPEATGINYYVLQEFVVQGSAGNESITIETNNANEKFIQGAADTIITVANAVSSSSKENSRQLYIYSANTSDAGRKITLTFSENGATPLRNNSNLKILIPVYVTNAKAKVKEKKTGATINVTGDAALEPIISLGKADAISVTSMTMAPNNLDVRDNYVFDSGQRDNLYGISSLSLVEGAPVATGDLAITFDYYEHTGEGDFFSVDSYVSDSGEDYAKIPVYAPVAGIPISQSTVDLYIQLRDCIDFRPIVNTTGANPSYLPTITANKSAVDAINFRVASNDGNGVAPRMPIVGSNFQCNIAFYQAKIDSLFMGKNGSLTLVEGATSDEPIAPPDLATGIRLYDFKLSPYTFKIDGIKTDKFNYKSYKMKDIVSLERRIGRLEELVSLSLLEQSALNMGVRDAVTGLDRFKNGMVVDNFDTHGNGETGSEVYRCSIDEVSTHLRSPHSNRQVELIEKAQTPVVRYSNGYVKKGPQLMLDYDEVVFSRQPFATRSINLQPYVVFTYDGDVTLEPAIDTWTDTRTAPDLVIRDNSLYDSMVNLTGQMTRANMGTVWGDWQDTGRTRTNVQRTNTPQNAGRGPGTANNWNPAVEVTTTTQSVQQTRRQTRTDIRVQTGRRQVTSYGDRVTDVSLARTMRSRVVRVNAGRLKPNTRYYIFFDEVDCTEWFAIDNTANDRFRTTPGTNSKGFGYPIISDVVGNIGGVFIIPNGRPPVAEQRYRSFNQISYQTSGPTRSFNTGTRKFKITTSITNSQDTQVLEGFAETTYVASGVIQDKQETIVATTLPSFSRTTSVVQDQNRWQQDSVSVAARVIGPPPAPRIIERTEVIRERTEVIRERTETVIREIVTPAPAPDPRAAARAAFSRSVPNRNDPSPPPSPGNSRAEIFAREGRNPDGSPVYDDPVAQTFTINNSEFPEGMFLSEVGVYFETKDPVEGVECYLTTTDGEVPTQTILPYSISLKNSDTTFRVKCDLGTGVTSTTIPAGTTFVGSENGGTAVLKSAITFNAASQSSTQNVSNTIYDVVFDNYVGDFLAGEAVVPQTTPAQTSTFTIVDDEVNIDYAEVTATGSDYSSASTITFTAPELPGGVTATGTVSVGATGSSGAGLVYSITMTENGSGYTKAPSATISDTTGSNATVAVRISAGREAIDMGVATSANATALTRFKLPSPVYLLGNTTYSFVLKAPTSLKYKAFTAKIGENEVGTQNRVTKIASLGSLFKSQNGGLWTPDQTQDIKFNLTRASFITNTVARIDFINEPLGALECPLNAITTDSNPLADSTSTEFGNNPKVVRVLAYWHGLVSGDLVVINGVAGNIGGIPDAEINTLHTVVHAGMNFFTIMVSTDATSNQKGGGSQITYTPNNEYECVNITTGAMTFSPTTLTASTTPTRGLSTAQSRLIEESPNSPRSIELRRRHYTRETAYDIELLETLYYSNVKTVASPINEAKFNGSQELNGEKSLEVACFMLTRSDTVSPVINFERTNANMIRNLVDYPDPTDPIFGGQVATLVMNGSSSGLTSVIAGSALAFTNADGVSKTVYVNSHDTATNRIVVRGDAVDDLKRSHTFTDAAVQALGTANIDISDGSLYYPEVNDRGSAWSKFISKLFIFENECDGIQLKLSACYYKKDSIRCYYRPRAIGFDGDLSGRNWIPFNPTQELTETVVDSNAQNALIENRQVVPGLPDNVNLITVRDSDNVNPAEIGPSGWKSLVWSAQDLPKFDAIAIKIVMVVENPALTPIIDDMQLVVTE